MELADNVDILTKGIAIADTEGKLVFCSAKFAQCFQTDPNRLQGVHFWKLGVLKPETVQRYQVGQVTEAENGTTEYSTDLHMHRDDLYIHLEVLRLAEEDAFEVNGKLCTYLLRIQSSETQSANAKRWIRLIQAFNHDIRGAATLIGGYADLVHRAASGCRESAKIEEYLSKITKAAQKLENKTYQVTTLYKTKHVAYEKHATNIVSCIQKVSAALKFTEKRKLSIQAADSDLICDIDPSGLQEVLQRILENSLQHQGEDSERGTVIQVNEGEDHVLIAIQDREKGVPSEAARNITDAFETFSEDPDSV